MPFKITEEEENFSKALGDLLAAECPLSETRKNHQKLKDFSLELTKKLRDFGLFQIGIEGGSFQELALAAYQEGFQAAPLPLIPGLVGGPGAGALAACSSALRGHFKNFDSSLGNCALSWAEPQRINVDELNHRLDYHSRYVFAPFSPNFLIHFVSEQRAVCVDFGSAEGLQITQEPSLDFCFPRSEISGSFKEILLLDQASSQLLYSCNALLMACAMLGASTRLVEMTREYVLTREQFGVPIAVFQAVSHKLAESYAQNESLNALVRFAAWALQNDPQQGQLASVAALQYAKNVCPGIAEVAIQLHGGIGFTWEYDAHIYLRRIRFYHAIAPKVDQQLVEVAQMIGGSGEF